MRYQAGSNLSLRNISFNIPAGIKVVVVGRTGAGKSSIISAILRLINLESGTIFIDGQDTSKLKTELLRSKISVIPQDPVLLQGEYIIIR